MPLESDRIGLPHILVVLASTRQGRFGDTVVRWLAPIVEERTDLTAELVDLRDWQLPYYTAPVPLPAYTPELQPAERLWTFSNTPLVNVRPTDLDELDSLQLDRCAALQTDPALVATIQSATLYHWWSADYSPIT